MDKQRGPDKYVDSDMSLSHDVANLATIESELRVFGGVEAVIDLEKVNQLSNAGEINGALGYLIKKISGE